MDKTCNKCNFLIVESYNFCPNCGAKFKNPPLSTTFSKQFVIYAICVLFPPFGLIPALKYIPSSDRKAKIVGIVALFITLITTAIVFYLFWGIYESIYKQMKVLKDYGLF